MAVKGVEVKGVARGGGIRQPLAKGMGPPAESDEMSGGLPEQVLLDENVEAASHDYFDLGGLEARVSSPPSPLRARCSFFTFYDVALLGNIVAWVTLCVLPERERYVKIVRARARVCVVMFVSVREDRDFCMSGNVQRCNYQSFLGFCLYVKRGRGRGRRGRWRRWVGNEQMVLTATHTHTLSRTDTH